MIHPVAILSFCLLLIGGHPLYAQQRDQAPVTFTKVSERVYQALGGRGSQTGFVIGDDGVLVVDAKMDQKSQEAVFAEIRRLTPLPVKYLVNTHGDGDHVTGNRYFPATVTIIAHEGCRKDFFLPGRDGKPSAWTAPELMPFVPSVTFSDRMNVYLGGLTVELHHFGVGHTIGDTVVFIPSEKTAFTGDQVSLPRAVYIHAYKGGEFLRQCTEYGADADSHRCGAVRHRPQRRHRPGRGSAFHRGHEELSDADTDRDSAEEKSRGHQEGISGERLHPGGNRLPGDHRGAGMNPMGVRRKDQTFFSSGS